jgi:hypothetical protein
MIGRMTMIGLVLMFWVCPGFVGAAVVNQSFEAGNRNYSDGNYVQAIEEYNKAVSAGYASAELYYNLGNAYFRDGQLGMAILNYVRARRLDPRDDDIQANLQFARSFAIDKIQVSEETILLDYVNRFFDAFSLNEITWAAYFVYLLVVGVILVRYVYRRIHVPTPAFAALVVLLVAAVILTGVKLDRDVLTRRGVVIAQQVEVKNGPGEEFTTKITAHAGLVFNIDREESGYYEVNFENRLKGWIPKTASTEI